jgi:glutathione S-transferase
MTDLILYHSPGACSRAPLLCLHKAKADYELRIVRLMAGENRAPAFQELNPKGKVPVLVRNGEALTENVAILAFLATEFPQAKLMPNPADRWGYAQALAWLSFGPTTLHPLVGRMRVPQKIVEGEQAQANVKAMAVAETQRALQVADARLANRKWLSGDDWMAPDAYLFWAVTRAGECGVDIARLPNVAAHYERMGKDPAVAQALEREKSAVDALPPAAPAQ